MIEPDRFSSTTQVVALCRFADIRPRLFQTLLHQFHGLDDMFQARAEFLTAINGMSVSSAKAIGRGPVILRQAEEYCRQLQTRQISVLTLLDDGFPELLLELNDPPPLLYVRGHMPDKSCKSVALVGAEDATHPGIELTVKLAGLFARAGVQVVSSISKGIDAAAHIGARASNGVSYGVLDSGLDHIHPSEHVPLAIDIAQSGGVISEYPPEQSYTDGNVASSNRLVAGLAQAVVVTEMYRTSERSHDLLRFCRQIGKLAFLMVDSTQGALADNESVAEAVACGAIPMTGLEKVQDIIRVLV